MATGEWIESAWQAGRRKPTKGDGFIDRKAQHILGGAHSYEQAETRRAARYTARQEPDLLPVLGLESPGRPGPAIDRFADDCLADLLSAIVAGNERAVLGDMNRIERQAARKALATRLEQR